MSETARWALPLLTAGQAQKEMTHNEALALVDLLAGASVVAIGVDTPPSSPAVGQCWIVGAAPLGAWSGRAQALAGWTAGGWRFVAPREGFAVWSEGDGCPASYTGGAWHVGRLTATSLVVGSDQVVSGRQPAITAPVGGTTVDAEARVAIAAIVAALATHGLIAA